MIAAALLTAIGLVMLYRDATGWNIYLEQLTFAPLPVMEDGHMPPAHGDGHGRGLRLVRSVAVVRAAATHGRAAPGAGDHVVAARLAGPVALRVRRRAAVRVHGHGGAHRAPVPAAVRRRADAAPRRRHGARCWRARGRRRHGAATAARRDRRAAAGRRAHASHRAARHVRLRGRGVDIRAVEHRRVRGLRAGSTPRAENAPTRCVAPPNAGCASPRSATSSSSRPHSMA